MAAKISELFPSVHISSHLRLSVDFFMFLFFIAVIILRNQDKKRRIVGIEALKVMFFSPHRQTRGNFSAVQILA